MNFSWFGLLGEEGWIQNSYWIFTIAVWSQSSSQRYGLSANWFRTSNAFSILLRCLLMANLVSCWWWPGLDDDASWWCVNTEPHGEICSVLPSAFWTHMLSSVYRNMATDELFSWKTGVIDKAITRDYEDIKMANQNMPRKKQNCTFNWQLLNNASTHNSLLKKLTRWHIRIPYLSLFWAPLFLSQEFSGFAYHFRRRLFSFIVQTCRHFVNPNENEAGRVFSHASADAGTRRGCSYRQKWHKITLTNATKPL